MIVLASTIIVLLITVAAYLGLVSSGEIITEKIELEIKIENVEKEYDKNPIVANYSLVSGSLLPGDEIKLDLVDDFIEPGTYNLNPNITIVDKDGSINNIKYRTKIVEYGVGTINKRKLSVKFDKDNVNHGEIITTNDFSISSGTLLSGDKLIPKTEEIETPEINGNPVAPTPTVINLTCSVVDVFGVDVTSNYDLTMNEKYLPVNKKILKISTRSATRVFDGTPLIEDNLSIIGLAPNHQFIINKETLPSITHVGQIENDLRGAEYKIIDEFNNDVSSYYKIIQENVGILKVTPKTINVITPSIECDYKGEEIKVENKLSDLISSEDYSFLNEIGYKLIVSAKNLYKDAGEYKNDINIQIIDSNENETKDITLNIIPGKITIKKLNIKIYAENISAVYDGFEHKSTNKYSLFGELANGESLQITYDNSSILKNAGRISNNISKYLITSGNNDTTRNYNVEIIPGVIEILPKRIDIKISDVSKIYDGKAVNEELKYNVTSGEFIKNDKISLSSSNYELKNVGVYTLDVDNHIIRDSAYNDVTNNYDVNITPAKVIISHRNLTIKANDLEVTYDTLKHTSDEQFTIIKGNAITNHEIKPRFSVSSFGIEAGEYINQIEKVTIVDENNNDVTKNYNLDIINGKIIINKRPISINLPLLLSEYDGTSTRMIDVNKISIDVNKGTRETIDFDNILKIKLEDNLVYLKDNTGRAAYIGKGKYKLDSYNINIINKFDGNKNVTSNFLITVNPGSFEIAKKTINVEYPIFDNIPYSNNKSDYNRLIQNNYDDTFANNPEVIDGDSIKAKYTIDLINGNTLGIKNIRSAITINNGSDERTDCYEINRIQHNVEIVKRDLTITPNSVEKVFDGKPFTPLPTHEYKEDGLMNGDKINLTYKPNVLSNVGVYDIDIENVIILSANNENMNEYYNIMLLPGKLTITPMRLTVKGIETKIDFTGDRIDLGQLWYVVEKLPKGYTVKITPNETPSIHELVNGARLTMKSYEVYDSEHKLSDNFILEFMNPGIVKYNDINLKIKATPYRTTYNKQKVIFGTNAEIDYEILGSSYLNKNNVKIRYGQKEIVNAGNHNVVIKVMEVRYGGIVLPLKDETGNGMIACNSATVKCIVERATLSVSTPSLTWTYGDEIPSLRVTSYIYSDKTITTNDFKSVTNLGVAEVISLKGAAGTYTNVIRIDDDNYNFIYNFGTLTIEKKEINLIAPSFSTARGVGIDINITKWLDLNKDYINTKNVSVLTSNEIMALDEGTHSIFKTIEFNKNYDVKILGGTITIKA